MTDAEQIHEAVIELMTEGIPIGVACHRVELSDRPGVLEPLAAVIINAKVPAHVRADRTAAVAEMMRRWADEIEGLFDVPDTIEGIR